MPGHTLTLHRPCYLVSDETALDAEYRAARWIENRLLDFEDAHQRILEEAAEAAAPGIVRIGRILARLARRARRRQRTTPGAWSPDPRPELAARLKALLPGLKERRDTDPRWEAALGWADEEVGEQKAPRRRRAKDPAKVRRRKSETDEAFAKRLALLTTDETEEHFAAKCAAAKKRTRREQYRTEVYAQRRCYAAAYQSACRAVDRARADVLRRRKQGLPAEWHRPRWRDAMTLCYDGSHLRSGFRIVERGPLWWVVELRIGAKKRNESEWVRLRAKCGNWHTIPETATIEAVLLTRRRDGDRWAYSLNLVVRGVKKRFAETFASTRTVALDWGHREHGHDRAGEGIRAFTWRGDDGATGEVLLPRACREMADAIAQLKSRLDERWNARKQALHLPDRNRHAYRARLQRAGVRTEEEAQWLRWEMRYERRIMACRKRSEQLRRETYLRAVQELRKRYAVFAIEDQPIHDAVRDGPSIRKRQTEEMRRHRQRENRDMTARYEFVSICERYGATLIRVSARNTTSECPDCGQLAETEAELTIVCPGCGRARDRDHGAARIILRRAQEALANAAAG